MATCLLPCPGREARIFQKPDSSVIKLKFTVISVNLIKFFKIFIDEDIRRVILTAILANIAYATSS